MASSLLQKLQSVLLLVSTFVPHTQSDFTCFCNYNIETAVYPQPNVNTAAIGYMYEFDCKPVAKTSTVGEFFVVQFEQQVGNFRLWRIFLFHKVPIICPVNTVLLFYFCLIKTVFFECFMCVIKHARV